MIDKEKTILEIITVVVNQSMMMMIVCRTQ